MTTAMATDSSALTSVAGHSSQAMQFAAWIVWMISMVATLAVFAARWPLAAKMPRPIEDGTLVGVGFVAMLLGVALAPALLATWRSALIAMLSIAPMLVLATLLSGRLVSDGLPPLVVAVAWLLAITALIRDRRPVIAAIVTAVLLLVTVGGPMLWYFGQEFGDRQASVLAWLGWLSPTQGVVATALHDSAWYANAILPIAIFAIERGVRFLPKKTKSTAAARA